MHIFIPKELEPETRAAALPESVAKLIKLGATVEVESGIGLSINISDSDYESAGATLCTDRKKGLANADLILRLRPPQTEEIEHLRSDSIHVSYLDPFNQEDLVQKLTSSGVSAISMEMIPRTTLAQKMDALSSQANLAGYMAVIHSASRLNKILPMMMTPSGTISPARVFIIGVGVAGLQAIATAKRLGARVEAFDTRPVVEEQVQSLGAKFVKVDLGETGQTTQGYAQALTPEQMEKQKQAMAKVCSQSDIVITTAQLFGRKAPVIVTQEMIKKMAPGSILLDMAVETGGNVEGSKLNEEVDVNGVKILAPANLPGHLPLNASQMYASNLVNWVEHFWNSESKKVELSLEDEIIQGCLITHQKEIVNQTIKERMK